MSNKDLEINNNIVEIGRRSRLEKLKALVDILLIKPRITNEEVVGLLEIPIEKVIYYRENL